MLPNKQKIELIQVVRESLDEAENIWNKVGDALVMANSRLSTYKAESVNTQIPGYPIIEQGQPKVDDFIAIVADMRDSTTHLLQAISQKTASVNQLQRVFYETSALLPSLAKAIGYENGKITEYLGDGILGLFCVNKEDKSETIYAANRAASKCLETVSDVVNPLIAERYSLPPLQIGVGLAYSKAVVTLVGLPNFMQPKVFGECVFRASKLSSGSNEVIIDKVLRDMWPTSKNGTLRFIPKKKRNVDGFLIQK